MNETSTPDPLEAEEARRLQSLADDEDYWDYLDQLETQHCGTREWDNATVGGAR